MVRFLLVTSNWPLVSRMVFPASELLKVMVLPLAASAMTWRSEPGPESLVFTTMGCRGISWAGVRAVSLKRTLSMVPTVGSNPPL